MHCVHGSQLIQRLFLSPDNVPLTARHLVETVAQVQYMPWSEFNVKYKENTDTLKENRCNT